jgi:hypothetical protein
MGSVTSAHRLRLRRTPSAFAIRSRWPVFACLVLGVACAGPAATPATGAARGEWRTFEGAWTASGTRTTLDLGPNRQVSIAHLQGSLVLRGENSLGVGFRAEIVDFFDTASGMVGRSVWTDERGDKVFSELTGKRVGDSNQIAGTFVSGTGRYAGVTGDFEFQWQYLLQSEGGSISGRTTGFKGRARIGATTGAPSGDGAGQ